MYEIPKIATPVVINLVNDETISGFIWLTENFISSTGDAVLRPYSIRMKIDFFHSKAMQARSDSLTSNMLRLSKQKPTTMVAHFVNEQTPFGMIYPSLPEESRVSDFLNLKSDFLVVCRQQKKIILNRNLIVYANAN